MDRAELTDYLLTAIKQATLFVERNTQLGMSIDRVRRRDLPAVPPAALREALVNAVVNADYAQRGAPVRVAVFDDRVEVESPGILLPGLTIDDLRKGVSRVRNRVLARESSCCAASWPRTSKLGRSGTCNETRPSGAESPQQRC